MSLYRVLRRHLGRIHLHVFLILSAIPPVLAAPPFEGQPDEVLARVYFRDRAQLNQLARRLDIWEVNQQERSALVAVDRATIDRLRFEGLRIEEEARQLAASTYFDYSCYRSVEQIEMELRSLARAYPDLVELIDIGDSWEKTAPGGAAGYDLWAVRLTQRQAPGPKPRLLVIAGMHARELVPPELAIEFVKRLLAGYGQNPDLSWILDYHEIHVVPLLNPDGHKYAEQGYYQRKNTNPGGAAACPVPGPTRQYGVDLNRNADWLWGTDESAGGPCDVQYQGTSKASERETQAIQNYILGLFPDQRGAASTDPAPQDTTGLVVNLHSYGNFVMWGWAYTEDPAPNSDGLKSIGERLSSLNGYAAGQSSSLLYLSTGHLGDFTYGRLGVPYLTFEIGDSFFPDCEEVPGLVARNLDALFYAARIAGAPYTTARGPQARIPGPRSIAGVTPTQVELEIRTEDAARRVTGGEVTIDSPPWRPGPRIALAPVDGSFDSATETARFTAPADQLSPGRHTAFIRAIDNAGAWGSVTSMFIEVTPSAAPDLALSIRRVGTFKPGAQAGYLFDVLNRGAGSTTAPLVLTDRLPEGLRLVSAGGPDWSCSPQGVELHCSRLAQLAPAETVSLEIDVEVEPDAAVFLTNRATISTEGDQNPLNNEAVESVTLQQAIPPPYQTVNTLFFPHFGDGAGLSTAFILTNPGPSTALGFLTFYDPTGSPMPTPFENGEVSSVPLNLAPNATIAFTSTGASSPFKSGYAEARLTQGTVFGMAIFRYADGRETSALGVQGGRRFSVPIERSAALESGLAVWRSSLTEPVEVSLYDKSGQLLSTRPMPIDGHQAARFINEIFEGLSAEFSGSVKIECRSSIAPLSLRFGQRAFSTVAVEAIRPPGQQAVENLVGLWVFSYPAEGVAYLDHIPIFETWEDDEEPGVFWALGANRNLDPVLGSCGASGANLVLVSPGALYDDIYELNTVTADTVSGCYYSRYKIDGSYSQCYALTGVKVSSGVLNSQAQASALTATTSAEARDAAVTRVLAKLGQRKK